MSLSNGRYRIFRDTNIMLTLTQKAPGADITVRESLVTDEEKQQWDVIGLENGNVMIQNAKAKLFLGHSGSDVVAANVPYQWTLKHQGPNKSSYIITAPDGEHYARAITLDSNKRNVFLDYYSDDAWWNIQEKA